MEQPKDYASEREPYVREQDYEDARLSEGLGLFRVAIIIGLAEVLIVAAGFAWLMLGGGA